MLQKINRLKNRNAFTATYKQYNIVADSNMCIYLGKKKEDATKPTKFGFVVSKKVHKRAVVRNRIKRLMRENVRLLIKNQTNIIFDEYMSVIFVGKNGAIEASYENLNSSLNTLISKISK